MNAKQYKQLKRSEDVLDFATLNATRRILAQCGQAHLAGLITRILSNNKIAKPSLHNTAQERFSDFYRVDLAAEETVAIVSALFDYEADVVDLNPSAADLTDRWNDLYEQAKR